MSSPWITSSRLLLQRNLDCGLVPIPLHAPMLFNSHEHVTCSCRNPFCAQTGKHPRVQWLGMGANSGKFVDLWLQTCQGGESPDSPFNWAYHLGHSGIFGLDIDPRNGGAESWAAIVEKYGPLPETPIDGVPGRGWKAWFRAPALDLLPHATTHVDNKAGVELKWGNNYFAGPPSTHAVGRGYVWHVAPWDVPFADPPKWLIDLAHEFADKKKDDARAAYAADYSSDSAYSASARVFIPGNKLHGVIDRARKYVATLPPAIQGQNGSKATFRAACVLVQGFSLSPADAFPLLQEYSDRCAPPWSDGELLHKLEDAARRPSRHPRGWLLESDRPRDPTRRPSWVAELDKEIAPFHGREITVRIAGRILCVIGGDGASAVSEPATAPEPVAITPPVPSVPIRRQITTPAVAPSHTVAAVAASLRLMRLTDYPCDNPYRIVLEDRGDGTPALLDRRCERWDCPQCAQLHKASWKENIRLRLWELTQNGSRQEVHVGIVPQEPRQQWGAVHKQLARCGAEYFRVAYGDDWLVAATMPFAGSVATPISDAISRLCGALDNYRGDTRPISSSRGWARPKPKDPDGKKKQTRFIRVGHVPRGTSEETLQEVFEACQVKPVDLPIPPAQEDKILRFRKLVRRGWAPGLKDHLYDCLFAGEARAFVTVKLKRGGGRAGDGSSDDHGDGDQRQAFRLDVCGSGSPSP